MTRGHETVEKEVWVEAHPAAVYEQFTRPEVFVELLPSLEGMEASGTLEDESQRLVLEYSTAGIPTTTEAVLTHCTRPTTIRYELVGDADGELVWGFKEVDGGTSIRCELTYVLSEAVLERLPARFAHRYNEREVTSLVTNLRDTVGARQS